MWIGLLGPLVVTTDGGQRVRVAAAKQRSLLAALVVQAGDVVPLDALAESVWEAGLPASWEVTIRNYVRRLRVVMGAEAGGRIITSPPGYLLKADENELDLLAFETLRRAGLAAARAGDWPEASARLSEAAALWRGTPFADIPSRLICDSHLPYLREAQLAVLEARIEADLHLSPSRAADVIPELQRLTSRHPERERLRGQLMLALYRSGRQGEALAVFRAARTFSVEELGVEPGPELIVLHQRILAADEGLLHHLGPTASAC
jgi:DNA-binding SARP family transcriptional activator